MNSTIAYSIKSGAWTTRYSFTPTCYGVIDKNLVSCNTVDTDTNDPKSFWIHNEWSESPQGNNNFYGTLYPTLLTVSANNNPSGNKIFKSLSLETNVDSWAFSFISEKDYGSNETQFTTIANAPMHVREGNRYVNIPRSEIWSSNNTVYIGECRRSGFPGQWFLRVNSTPDSPVMYGDNSILTVYNDQGQLMAFDRESGAMSSFSEVSDPVLVTLVRISSEDRSVLIFELNSGNGFPQGILEDSSFTNPDNITSSCFITTPSKVDGDFMRGKSCLITMSCTPPEDPSIPKLELYSIGMEYEFSELDSRLG